MKKVTRSRVEQFWARRLACPVSLFREAGLHFLTHPTPETIFVISVGSSVIVAAPMGLHAELAQISPPSSLVEPPTLQRLALSTAEFIGPAFVGYAASMDALMSDLVRFSDVQALELQALRAAVSSREWQQANLGAAASPIIAALAAGAAVSAAGAEHLLDEVAHIGVVTHPWHRGRGLARRVVSAVAAEALSVGLLPQYQALLSNRAAIAVAQALGFEQFATTLAVAWVQEAA